MTGKFPLLKNLTVTPIYPKTSIYEYRKLREYLFSGGRDETEFYKILYELVDKTAHNVFGGGKGVLCCEADWQDIISYVVEETWLNIVTKPDELVILENTVFQLLTDKFEDMRKQSRRQTELYIELSKDKKDSCSSGYSCNIQKLLKDIVWKNSRYNDGGYNQDLYISVMMSYGKAKLLCLRNDREFRWLVQYLLVMFEEKLYNYIKESGVTDYEEEDS